MYRMKFSGTKTTVEEQDAMFVTLSGMTRVQLKPLAAGITRGNASNDTMRAYVAKAIAGGWCVLTKD